MTYSRNNPSPRYRQLQEMYRTLHAEGQVNIGVPAEKTFPGLSLAPQIGRIKRLITLTGAETILDYGSGKGQQYQPQLLQDGKGGEWSSVIDYWDVDEIVCYDPAYPPYNKLPTDQFDGVISTDVLEHCPEEDIPWILEEIFGFARKFVFANVACFPAKKQLPNGENAHCTIRPPEWWREIIGRVAATHPGVNWEFWIVTRDDTGPKEAYVEQKITNL